MLLTAAVTKAEIVALFDALTPIRIAIDASKGRYVTLGRPRLELIADTGLRLRGDANITWGVAGMSVPVTIQNWQVMLLPRVVTRGKNRVLQFEPVIEELDLKRVPGFLDDKIAKAIGDGIAQNREKLVFDFTKRLTKRWPLPQRLGAGAFALDCVDGAIEVTADQLLMTLRFEPRIATNDVAPRSTRGPKSVRAPKSVRSPKSVRHPELR